MRYALRRVFQNRSKTYEKILEEKGLKRITQYPTPKLKHLDAREIRKLNRVGHIWKVGDRFYKLAYKHYGKTKYWWVIAWYNRKPTESHVNLGDVIYVPLPLDEVVRSLGL